MLFMCAAAVRPAAAATHIRFTFRGPSNEPVHISKAELLTVAWGETERFDLPFEGDTIRAPLDPEWLRSRWPRFDDMMRVFIYVQADGYAAIRSNPFIWIGGKTPPRGAPATRVVIDFRQGPSFTVNTGEEATAMVRMRRPERRSLRFVDDDGNAVADARISAMMFWSAENHCGVIHGADRLIIDAPVDREGRLAVPDADFEYAVVLEAPHHAAIANAFQSSYPTWTTMFLTGPESLVRVHRFKRRRLELVVLRDGKPASGVAVMAIAAGCPCGYCGGPYATTDSNGRIRDDNFYAEEFSELFIGDYSDPDWIAAAKTLPSEVTIRLPR